MLSPQLHTRIGSGSLLPEKSLPDREEVEYPSAIEYGFESLLELEIRHSCNSRDRLPRAHPGDEAVRSLLSPFRCSSLSYSTRLSSTRCRFARQPFPFPQLISAEYWEHPKGDYPGWAPGKVSLLHADGHGEYALTSEGQRNNLSNGVWRIAWHLEWVGSTSRDAVHASASFPFRLILPLCHTGSAIPFWTPVSICRSKDAL